MMKSASVSPVVKASLCYSLFISSLELGSTRARNCRFPTFINSRSFIRTVSAAHKSMSTTSKDIMNLDTAARNNTNQNPLTSLNLPSPLILGSNSFTRKLILEEMNIPFLLKVKPINEYEIGIRENESYAKDLVLTLAKAKADALVQGLLDCNNNDSTQHNYSGDNKYDLRLPNYSSSKEYIILTADQVVTCNDKILEKPQSIEEAHAFIKSYSQNAPKTVGSVVLTHLPSMEQVFDVDISTIYFKPSIGDNCEELVTKLLDDDAPILSCAGGLMIEHPFVQEYIDNIDGSIDGVMGLSKSIVLRLLKQMKEKIIQKSIITQSTKDKIQKIQDIIGRDDGDRGMKALIVKDDLLEGAIHIASLLSSKDSMDQQTHVVILSGFPCCVNESPPTETDGPPGAVAIAKCLLAFGQHVHVTIITDKCNEDVFQAAIGDGGTLQNNKASNKIQLQTFPSENDMKEEDYKQMKEIVTKKCDLIVACERAGPGADGKCYTMRGIDMTSKGLIAPLHNMVDMVRMREDKNVKFIAIGDGGNELGMGKVIDKIQNNPKISNGELIGAVTCADHLIAASVSNWGGYALAAACALVKSDIEDSEEKNVKYWVEQCIPGTQHEIDLLDRCVSAGCRDGVSGKMEATVDGMPLQTSLDCLENIIAACN